MCIRDRLQALTEFFSPPSPTIQSTARYQAGMTLTDQTLSFGTMQMIQGRAFLMGTNSTWTRVSKQWVLLDGRRILVEEVPINDIASELAQLLSLIHIFLQPRQHQRGGDGEHRRVGEVKNLDQREDEPCVRMCFQRLADEGDEHGGGERQTAQ